MVGETTRTERRSDTLWRAVEDAIRAAYYKLPREDFAELVASSKQFLRTARKKVAAED